jgi:hypothetical protein
MMDSSIREGLMAVDTSAPSSSRTTLGGVCADPAATFKQLLTERPAFHGLEDRVNLNLMDAVQQWMFDNVQDGWVTLETGCGYSSIIMSMKGAYHTVISPFAEEHQRLKDWLTGHGVKLDRVSFIADGSEHVLPNLKCPPLDLVLIDGRHSFPTPFIDWYYTAEKLKVGGYVLVDDTNIRACGILRDFLADEEKAGRWEKVITLYRTTVFRKKHERVHHNIWWAMQPWGLKADNWTAWFGRLFHNTLKYTIGRSPKLKAAIHAMYSKLRNRH